MGFRRKNTVDTDGFGKKDDVQIVDEKITLRDSAFSGDIIWALSPSALSTEETSEAWTREVLVSLENSDGEVHDWFTKDITTGVSIAYTSLAGTASIESTTLSIVNGIATIEVSGDAEAWLGGTSQVETITCTAGESTGAGDITMTITSAGMENSPKAVAIGVLESDDVNAVALAVRTALSSDEDVSGFFVVGGEDADVILTAITPTANDITLAFGFVDTDLTGVTFGASTNTTAGVERETNTLTVAETSILGYTVGAKTSVQTFIL